MENECFEKRDYRIYRFNKIQGRLVFQSATPIVLFAVHIRFILRSPQFEHVCLYICALHVPRITMFYHFYWHLNELFFISFL